MSIKEKSIGNRISQAGRRRKTELTGPGDYDGYFFSPVGDGISVDTYYQKVLNPVGVTSIETSLLYRCRPYGAEGFGSHAYYIDTVPTGLKSDFEVSKVPA